MKVFIAVRVPRSTPEPGDVIRAVTQAVQAGGHTAFVGYQEIARRGLSPEQFMPYVRQEISTSDLIIVVYSADLRGGLIELGIAYGLGIPVWLAVRSGVAVSSSTRASASQIFEYWSAQELKTKLQQCFLNGEM
jgi:nucleoside 2-deoxyribosyltransferase